MKPSENKIKPIDTNKKTTFFSRPERPSTGKTVSQTTSGKKSVRAVILQNEKKKLLKRKSPSLATPVVQAWESCLMGHARFAKGTVKTGVSRMYLLRKLVFREKPKLEELDLSAGKRRQIATQQTFAGKHGLVTELLSSHLTSASLLTAILARTKRSLSWKQVISKFPEIQIYDWGARTGALASVWLEFVQRYAKEDASVSVELFEANSAFLDGAEAILRELDPDVPIKRVRRFACQTKRENVSNVKTESQDKLHIYNLGPTSAELLRNRDLRASVIGAIATANESGEPMLLTCLDRFQQNDSRSLMVLRDELVAMGLIPLYPCPQGSASCPMLKRSRDWCYSEFDFSFSKEQEAIARILEQKPGFLKGTGFIFASKSLCTMLDGLGLPEQVVVGRPKSVTSSDSKHSRNEQKPKKIIRNDDFSYLICTGGESELLTDSKTLSITKVMRRGSQVKYKPRER